MLLLFSVFDIALGIAMTVSRILLLSLFFLVAGCDVEVKVKVGNSEKSGSHEKPWQVYATNKETKNLRYGGQAMTVMMIV